MSDRNLKYAETLAKMLRCETVSVNGQTDLTKFYTFHELLKELFPHIFEAAEYEDFNGSFLLRWKGAGEDSLPVLFMNHHDVVEANGAWLHEPFSGDIAEGKVWGRGALDTKGGLFGMLQAADELAAAGFVPKTDIYFESANTEEINGDGCRHIAEVLEERGVRFSFVLDEGGMIVDEPISGAKGTYAMVAMGEKGIAELRFVAKGNGGHSSTPGKNTPLVRLGRFMADVDDKNVFEAELSPVIREMFRRLAPGVSGPMGKVFAKPDLFAPLLKKAMPAVSSTAKALLQTTVAFCMAQGSDGRNVIPTEASLIASMRVSHHQGFESSLEAIRKVAEKYDVETEVLEAPVESGLADYKNRGFKVIEKAVDRCFPGVKSVPYIMTGASDARFMHKLCENCYRFVPFVISHEQLESIHGVNECVDIETLAPAVDFYKLVMQNMK